MNEIEEQVKKLDEHPLMKTNKWRTEVIIHLIPSGLKICTIQIKAGYKQLFSVTRSSQRISFAIGGAFAFVHSKLTKMEEKVSV
jgi:hypothetical protein